MKQRYYGMVFALTWRVAVIFYRLEGVASKKVWEVLVYANERAHILFWMHFSRQIIRCDVIIISPDFAFLNINTCSSCLIKGVTVVAVTEEAWCCVLTFSVFAKIREVDAFVVIWDKNTQESRVEYAVPCWSIMNMLYVNIIIYLKTQTNL